MSWLSILFFASLLGFFLIPGFFHRDSRGEFFLAGRRAGSGTVAGSLLATCLGASATSGLVGRACVSGWGVVWWLGAGSLGLLGLGLFWVPVMRSSGTARTLPEWAGETYGPPARKLAAGVIALMWIGVIAAQWTAAGSLLAILWGWPIQWGILPAALCVIAYTMAGGQSAVLRTDRWQLGLMALALVAAFVFAGRLPAASSSGLAPAAFRLGGAFAIAPLDWLALVVVVGGMYAVGPDLCSRVLTARDRRAARRGAFLAAAGLFPAAFLIVGTGVAIHLSGQAPPTAREALPWLINRAGVMPAWLAALVDAGLLAAMLSSADTCLLTAASVLELDLLGRDRAPAEQERRARWWVVGLGAASVILACLRPRIIPNLLLAYAFYTGGLLAPLLLLGRPALARRLPRPLVWWAIVIGGLTPVLLLLTGSSRSSARAGLAGAALCAALLAAGLLYATRKTRTS